MNTNQNYLKKKIKEYITKNYKNIPLKYVKDETSWVKERWTYENDDITIVKRIIKSDMFSCNGLDCNFNPVSFFSTYNYYYVQYKDIELINDCDTKEIFDKLEELKKLLDKAVFLCYNTFINYERR